MKILTEILAVNIEVRCPHCSATQDGFFGDPRGKEFECDDCEQMYKIHPDADIEMR